MRKWITLAIIACFAASAMTAIADEGPKAEKTVFQTLADPITSFSGRVAPADKYEAKGAFQKTANTVAGIGEKSTGRRKPPPKGIFQNLAHGVSNFTSWLKGEKSTYTGTPTGTFQDMKDYVVKHVKSSPEMKASSLRGRKDELTRRRMQ